MPTPPRDRGYGRRSRLPNRICNSSRVAGSLVVIALALMPASVLGGELIPNLDPQTDEVTWGVGAKPGKNKVQHTIPANRKETFFWTDGKKDADGLLTKHPDYGIFENTSTAEAIYKFNIPDDKTITDWRQKIYNVDGTKVLNDLTGANIKRESPWSFHPLDELPDVYWSIPDFGSPLGSTIYSAVNLELYFSRNPFGPLNGQYSIGQTLGELGLSIVDGRIPGIEGLYFATSEFTFDPASVTGLVPTGGPSSLLDSDQYEAANGSLAILGVHHGVPEPPALILQGIGTLAVLGYAWGRGRRSSRGRDRPVPRSPV